MSMKGLICTASVRPLLITKMMICFPVLNEISQTYLIDIKLSAVVIEQGRVKSYKVIF